MDLYERAVMLKRKAEICISKGEWEKAEQYLKDAINTLKLLERKSHPEIRKIWTRAIEQLQTALEVIKYRKGVEIPSLPEKETVERRKIKVPQECMKEFLVTELPTFTFKDLAGLEEVKKEIRESIEWQIKYPEKLKKLGIEPLKGVLLYGPPGCGKTFLVKCASGEFKIPLISADPAAIMSKYVGESEKIVKQIFTCAIKMSPAIIFVDEVDKLLPKVTTSSDAPKRVEAQFLQEMDGVRSGKGFITVFATNEPWNISPALFRPGRVDRIIYVPPPDNEARRRLFELYLRNVDLASDVDINELVKLTSPNSQGYYSSSGIKAICDEAKRELMRIWTQKGVEVPLNRKMIIEAMRKTPRSITHSMVQQYKKWADTIGTRK